MIPKNRLLPFLFGLLIAIHGAIGTDVDASVPTSYGTTTFNRSSFPSSFVFGFATSAYQHEGAASVDGRGPSIWDTYSHKYPERISDGSNGDFADGQYHRYKEDVRIMKEMGLDGYRFSISWSRILPNGKLSGGVNKKGVEYYNNLINELLANGIQPYVTLYHWDLPQTLEDEYGGFLSPRVVNDLHDYVDVCFQEFGDRVKHWITLNEPWSFSYGGYDAGLFAPGRCSAWLEANCTGGDSGTEPYLVGHHLLLAHGAAVKLYREKYQASQKGQIGVTLVSHWFEPYSNSEHNKNAALRGLDFMLGWFLDPIVNGDYPYSIRSLVGNRLPRFSKQESKILKGSMDFLGLNYYTTNYAHYAPQFASLKPRYSTDALANLTLERNGIPIGPPTASSILNVYPKGIWKLLLYIKNNYGNPPVYITENGFSEVNNATMLTLKQQLADPLRIDFYYRHLWYLRRAIKEGANVKGFFGWTLLDTFEWSSGFTLRFGVIYVDYLHGLKRYPKASALWFRSFLKKKN